MRTRPRILSLILALLVTVPVWAAQGFDDVELNQNQIENGFLQDVSNPDNDQFYPDRDRSGGPDQGGYSWRDEAERGVTYEWIDISQTGTRLAATDDWNSGVLNFGWNFPWYGTNYNSFRVCSNGWVSLDPAASQTTASLVQCPNAAAPNALFAVNNYDLNPAHANGGGNVYWYTNNQDIAIVTWSHVVQYGQINNWQTFQVIFKGDGSVQYQYAELNNVNGSLSNIGFESPNGQQGLNIAYRQANFLHANMAIKIATRFLEYNGPGIAITPAELNFPNTFVGYESTVQVQVENNGAQTLILTGIECDDNAFILPVFEQEVSIASGEHITTEVGFRPGNVADYNADIRILSNAENAQDGVTIVPAHGAGLIRPELLVSSNAFQEEINSGDHRDVTLTLSNRGGSPLTYTTDFEIVGEGARDDAGVRSLREVGPVREELSRDLRGGPDNTGYEWRTNDDRLGPDFEWIDITGNGARLAGGDDWLSAALDLGWQFPWYGRNYTSLKACSNGWATLDVTHAAAGIGLPQAPNAAAPNALLLINNYDLNTALAGAMYFWTNQQDKAVVSWVGVAQYGQVNNLQSFQIILENNGMVTYQYMDLQNVNGVASNIGFEGPTGTNGLNISYRQANFLHNNLAIGISNSWHTWISWLPSSGSIDPDASDDITITLEAEGLLGGLYEGDLIINSNDPEALSTAINIQMDVTGIPDMICSWANGPDLFDFNASFQDLFAGEPYQMVLQVVNIGTDVLTVSNIWCDENAFTADPVQFDLAPDASQDVVISFQVPEDAPGIYEGTFTVESNDPAGDFTFPVHARTFLPPQIGLNTNEVISELFSGDVDQQNVTITNNGDALLRWTSELVVNSVPERDRNARSLRTTGPERIDPTRDPRGGPDGVGYEWRSSHEWDGPNFEWIDITENGERLAGGDDWLSAGLALGWDFPWYGQNYGSLKACSNGWVTFDVNHNVSGISLPQAPAAGAPNALLLANNYDLNTNVAGAMYFWTNQQDMAVISWVGVAQYAQAGVLQTFQIILQDNGMVTYQYRDLQNVNGSLSNIGFESPDGQAGLNIAYHQANFLENDMAIGISDNWVDWVLWAPQEGEVESGQSSDIVVSFNADGLIGGSYEATLSIFSNDPNNQQMDVAISLEVTGVPLIAANWAEGAGYPDVVDWNLVYEDLFTETPYSVPIVINNDGTTTLTVNSISCENQEFTADLGQFDLAPGTSQEVILTFTAADGEEHNAELVIASNAHNAEQVTIPLHARPASPPTIDVAPQFIEDALMSGATSETRIAITNQGDALLRWTTSFDAVEQNRDNNARALRSVGPARENLSRDARGGPDEAGYEWRSSDEQDGPDFNWIDISEVGTRLAASDDWNSGVLALDWDFPWYGQNFSSIRVCSNGWVSLDPNADQRTIGLPQCPNAAAPNALFAISNDDYAPNNGGNMYFWTNQQDMAVVSWVGVPEFGNANNIASFQLVLQGNGMALYQYGALQNINGAGSNIGFETPDGQGGFNISYQQADFLHSDMSIGIANAWHNWISWAPEEGEVEAGQEGETFVTLGAEGLLGGIYEGSLFIHSNAPVTPDVEVLISLEVTGIPEIEVTWGEELGYPNWIDWNAAYADLFFGNPYDVEVTVLNSGTDELVVENIDSGDQIFTANPTGFSLAPGDRQIVTFTMLAQNDGVHEGIMVILSNAENDNEFEIPVRGETFTSPVIILSRNQLESNLLTGGSEEQSIRITNDGGANLRWETDVVILEEPQRDNSSRQLRSVGPVAEPLTIQPLKTTVPSKNGYNGKDVLIQAPTNPGNPFRDPRGGPDNAGYEWRSSDEGDGPDFAWIDITEIGQNLQADDDWLSGTLQLGWEFPWYGQNYASLKVNSNGFATFDVNYNGFNISLPQAPNAAAPNATLMANNYDLDPSAAGAVYFWTNEQNTAVISWVGVPQFFQNGNLQSFQIVLNNNGMVTYQYQNLQNVNGALSNIGFESPDGQAGLNISFHQANFLRNDLAIGISNNWLTWLAWEPESGELEPDAEQDVIVTFDAEDLIEGAYSAELHFLSNDENNNDAVVDVVLNVTGIPMVASDPLAHPFDGAPEVLEFSDTYLDESSAMNFTLFNTGSRVLTVEGINSNNNEFSTDLEAGTTLDAGDQRDFVITFLPAEIGNRQGTLDILTDGQNVGEGDEVGHIWFDLAGLAQLPPAIGIEPDPTNTYEAGLNLGDGPVTQVMTISNIANEGGDLLEWSIYSEIIERVFPQRDAPQRSLRSVSRDAGPVRDRRGGPDESAIEWRDNNEDDGPDFEWIDIVGIQDAQQLNPDDDWNSGVLDLGFQMPYYGQNYGSVRVCSNGWLTFDANYAQEDYPLPQMPNANGVNSTVSIIGYDLNPSDGGQMWYWTDRAGMAVVAWVDVPAYGNDATRHTMQIVLNANGLIKLQYGVMENLDDADVNAGFENQDGQIGFSCYYHEAGIHEGLAIGFGPREVWGIPWLAIDPTNGETPVGESDDVTLTFSADGLQNGTIYRGVVSVRSNDLANPLIEILVTLSIGFELPPGFDFGETDQSHNLLITGVTFDDEAVPDGWVVGVFTPGGVLSGAGVWRNQDLGLAVWGADETYPDQFQGGETMNLKLWNPATDEEWNARAVVQEGNMVWQNNAVTVLAIEANSTKTLEVALRAGWNLISINVTPTDEGLWAGDPGPEIIPMMAQLRRPDNGAHHVNLMKNERGLFYAPNQGFNGIPFWNLEEGYLVRVDEAMTAQWTGTPIDAQADITISRGWNMIAYFPDYQLPCRSPDFYAIASILDHVIIFKNGMGDFSLPSRRFSNMPPLREGQGYQINVSQDVVLNYPQAQNQAAALSVDPESVKGRWADVPSTGVNMSVLVTKVSGVELSTSDQVAAFSPSGLMVGVGRVIDGQIGIAVWGDDASTQAVDGLKDGEAFTLKLWNAAEDVVVDLSSRVIEGDRLVYLTDGFTVIDASVTTALPTEFYLSQNYPNPFNAVTRVAFGLPEASRVTVRVFDLSGREVSTLVSGELQAGHHSVVLDGESMVSGVYIVKMEATNFSAVRKVMLVK